MATSDTSQFLRVVNVDINYPLEIVPHSALCSETYDMLID